MDAPAELISLPTAETPQQPRHPLGSRARVLLTGVFGPYGRDDDLGSRALNPMELYQNQVTRGQGPFSLRMFHRSWGIMLIQSNIEAPTAVLDFPTLDRFIEELKTQQYDVIGITAIMPNLMKVERMCQLIRQYQPSATIVVGGHIATVPDLAERIDADQIVRGEGVGWFRRFLGEPDDRPIRHPLINSGFGTRCGGITVRETSGDVAASLIPSVGCPLGCNFCSTSAMFGGKGKCTHFYATGDELFDVMCQLEEQMGICSFFTMDENFLLHRKRALRLLELMEQHDKAWALYVFSSARVLRSYTIDQLVRLGVSWVWMGLEGKDSKYTKLDGVDTHELVRELQSHGIRVLGSTIIGMEEHTDENIDAAIDYAVSHDTDFHQFMLYTPIPGTPLHAELTAQGRMKDSAECHPSDVHGQLMFNYRHPNITPGHEGEIMQRAFRRNFEVNGPSVVRVVRSTLLGWRRYKNHPDARVRRRYAWEARRMATSMSALVGAARLFYRGQPELFAKMDELARELAREFGIKSRFFQAVGGRYMLWQIRREQRRLASGWLYEPPTFYEKNFGPAMAGHPDPDGAEPCRYVALRIPPPAPARNVSTPAPASQRPVRPHEPASVA